MCDISARMHCLAERRSKIGQTVTGKYANAMRVSNSIAAATARPTFFRFIPLRRALQTCGKLFQRATPRAFVWFAARPESSEETRASLSRRFPPCATEPSDESYIAPSACEANEQWLQCDNYRLPEPVCPNVEAKRCLADQYRCGCGQRYYRNKDRDCVIYADCGSFQSSVGREEHIGMAQSAVSNTIYEVMEAVIISVATRAARRKLDFPPTPWLPRMRRRRRLRYSATSKAC
ncbi:hypothetical protein HPB50_012641 [Hyalomma asiaticum]|uniref:Uncharacterized protein n=1 Tax=Hyalomma asiaticum TaxID=266040 RepID=A0ACB7S2C0_HYAAI|nr:hypothetical protein HPB50_012641 [Hyalomma asiaticum]